MNLNGYSQVRIVLILLSMLIGSVYSKSDDFVSIYGSNQEILKLYSNDIKAERRNLVLVKSKTYKIPLDEVKRLDLLNENPELKKFYNLATGFFKLDETLFWEKMSKNKIKFMNRIDSVLLEFGPNQCFYQNGDFNAENSLCTGFAMSEIKRLKLERIREKIFVKMFNEDFEILKRELNEDIFAEENWRFTLRFPIILAIQLRKVVTFPVRGALGTKLMNTFSADQFRMSNSILNQEMNRLFEKQSSSNVDYVDLYCLTPRQNKESLMSIKDSLDEQEYLDILQMLEPPLICTTIIKADCKRVKIIGGEPVEYGFNKLCEVMTVNKSLAIQRVEKFRNEGDFDQVGLFEEKVKKLTRCGEAINKGYSWTFEELKPSECSLGQ